MNDLLLLIAINEFEHLKSEIPEKRAKKIESQLRNYTSKNAKHLRAASSASAPPSKQLTSSSCFLLVLNWGQLVIIRSQCLPKCNCQSIYMRKLTHEFYEIKQLLQWTTVEYFSYLAKMKNWLTLWVNKTDALAEYN